MRHLAVLLLATLLAACATSAPAGTPSASAALPAAPDSDSTNYLLDSAAADFRTHPPTPSAFRNVRYGQLVADDGTVSHRLCGEFQVQTSDSEPEWKAFATLKTSAYEQWLGDTAYCSDKVRWMSGDLSTELQRRFDATR